MELFSSEADHHRKRLLNGRVGQVKQPDSDEGQNCGQPGKYLKKHALTSSAGII
jgi:hypothetical protein